MEEINKRENDILTLSRNMCEGKTGEFTGVAFISFQTENMKQEILSRYHTTNFNRFRYAFKFLSPKNDNSGLFLRGERIYISQAAEPGDVYWKNLHLLDKERFIRKFMGYLFSIVLLLLCALLISHLLVEQNTLKNESKIKGGDEASDLQIKALTIALAVSIAVINKVLGFLIPFIAA